MSETVPAEPQAFARERPDKALEKKNSFDQKHRIARAGFLLDRFLSSVEKPDLNDFYYQNEIDQNELPGRFVERATQIIANYQKQHADAEIYEKALRSTSADPGDPGADTSNDEIFGKKMFCWIRDAVVKSRGEKAPTDEVKPVGRVLLCRKEAYFILYCEDRVDYERIRGKKDDSGGVFHRALKTLLMGREISLVIVHGYPGIKNGEDQILLHERQHFINHNLLDLFETEEFNAYSTRAQAIGLEVKREEFKEQTKKFRAIKDEVLAYIRDGRSGKAILDALVGPLYSHLFSVFSKEEKNLVDDILQEICLIIDDPQFKQIWSGQDNRALIVYHLIGVPLLKFPDKMKDLCSSYQERVRAVSKTYDEVNTGRSQSFTRLEEKRAYPPSYQRYVDEGGKEKEAIDILLSGPLKLITWGNYKDALPHLEKIEEAIGQMGLHMKKLKEIIGQLEFEGIRLPYCDSWSSSDEEHTDSPDQAPTDLIERIRGSILNVLMKHLHEHRVDKIMKEQSRRLDVLPVILDGLQTMIQRQYHGWVADCSANFPDITWNEHKMKMNVTVSVPVGSQRFRIYFGIYLFGSDKRRKK